MRRIFFLLGFVFFAAAIFGAPRAAMARDSGTYSLTCLGTDTNITGGATISITPASLAPPNHKLRNETVTMNLNNDSATLDNYSFTIENITDDQTVQDDEGRAGCGQKTKKQGADWFPTETNIDPLRIAGNLQFAADTMFTTQGQLQLRGERCGRLGTRTYLLSVTCCDNRDSNTPICDPSPQLLRVMVPKNGK